MFVNEDFERQKFDNASEELHGDFTSARLIALNSPFMVFYYLRAVCLILYFGSYLIVSSQRNLWWSISSLITWLRDAHGAYDAFLCLCSHHRRRKNFAVSASTATSFYRAVENLWPKVADGSIDLMRLVLYTGPGGSRSPIWRKPSYQIWRGHWHHQYRLC